MYHRIKVEPQDWPSLPKTLTDGSTDISDRDIPFHLVKNNASVYKRVAKPIWRLPDHHHDPTSTSSTASNSTSSNNNSLSGIKPAEMMHVAVNYGGLPGLAYIQSLTEFTKDIRDDDLQETVARRADLLTDRAYSIGCLVKQANEAVKHSECSLDLLGECLQTVEWADMLENNEKIIKVLGDHALLDEDSRFQLLHKLHSQLSVMTKSPINA